MISELEKSTSLALQAAKNSNYSKKAVKAEIEFIESKIPGMKEKADRKRAWRTIQQLQKNGRNFKSKSISE